MSTVPRPLTWLSAQDEAWRDKVRSFARTAIAPRVREMDEAGRIAPDLIAELFAAELMGIEVPPAYGGAGGDLFAVVLAIEEIARVDPSVAVLVDVQNALVVSALLRHGDGDARRRYLPRLATGTVGAYAITEDQAGSDAFAMGTTAVADGDGYVLTGAKKWTSSAAEAGLFLVFARLAEAGVTGFLVERDSPGLTVGQPVDKLGVRASSTCDVVLDQVRVPRGNVLGRPGGGQVLAVQTLNLGKVGIAAQLVGLASAAIEHAVAYAESRQQFGGPLSGFQGVTFPLARTAARIEAARALLYNTARMLAHDGDPRERLRATAMAKYVASEVAQQAATLAVDTLGGNGFVPQSPVEKLYRDAKVGTIYEGTSNMQFRTIWGTLPKGTEAGEG